LAVLKPRRIQDPVEIGHITSIFLTIFTLRRIKTVIEVFAYPDADAKPRFSAATRKPPVQSTAFLKELVLFRSTSCTPGAGFY
jgi:hypothetical protein